MKASKKKAAPRGRIKGEVVVPTAAFTLVQRIGVTKAAKEMGVSTTTLHKARKGNTISRSHEIAAQYVLEHLSDHPRTSAASRVQTWAPIMSADGDTALIVMEVPVDKAPMVQKFAEHLGAKLVAA